MIAARAFLAKDSRLYEKSAVKQELLDKYVLLMLM